MFRVQPKRWVAERTLVWLNWSRRLSKDYELLYTTAKTMILVAFAQSAAAATCVVFKQVLRTCPRNTLPRDQF
jgi:hypothetical protein